MKILLSCCWSRLFKTLSKGYRLKVPIDEDTMSCPSHAEPGRYKLNLTWKLSPSRLAYMVPGDTVQTSKGGKQSLALPMYWSKGHIYNTAPIRKALRGHIGRRGGKTIGVRGHEASSEIMYPRNVRRNCNYEIYQQSFLNMNDTSTHPYMRRGIIMESHVLAKDYRLLRNAESRRNRVSQGRAPSWLSNSKQSDLKKIYREVKKCIIECTVCIYV